VVGLSSRVRLARDYYVRVDTNDYSVDPRMIGRLVDVTASPTKVLVTCEGMVVAEHARSWAHRIVITDPVHVSAAKTLRAAFGLERAARERASRQGARRHEDGTAVILRALPDYDALFGVDFTPAPHHEPETEPETELELGSAVAVDLSGFPVAGPAVVNGGVVDGPVLVMIPDAVGGGAPEVIV
jgi:hypothetical protein